MGKSRVVLAGGPATGRLRREEACPPPAAGREAPARAPAKADSPLDDEGPTPGLHRNPIGVNKEADVSPLQGTAKVQAPRACSVKFSIFMKILKQTN